ncbi:MAG: methionine--tRNA ligase [Candidatus Pacebacteria bacterium]|nr:methionine--tRNA ligase [Candidatus Paceibacterota bacterium]
MQNKTFYLTTTLPYVNAPLHMGHALEFVRADAVARYKKLVGFDVYFNTGTDEHGIKILEGAKKENLDPKAFVDKNFEIFKEQLSMFGLLPDAHFIRTTDEYHIQGAQEFWRRVYDNGYIYKKNYQAKYCVGCESEKTDSELDDKGECPLHPGRPLELIDEENYFFKFSAFGDKLLDFYEKNPTFITPVFRLNEMENFVRSGLQDFSISRRADKMPWGIPVPNDDEHVMYVWFDALTNYINTLGWPNEGGDFEKYWLNGNPTQYCGKDNTRFQGVTWQAMLMAAGVPNSHQIVVNGFITGEGGIRMSKTLGNGVDPRDVAVEYGTDALRYFLLREVSSFEDSSFTMERFKNAYNSGLANGLGNLTSRIMTMATNYEVKLNEDSLNTKYFTEPIKDLENFEINAFVNNVWANLKKLDEDIQREEPFKKIKVDPEGAKSDVMYLLKDLYKNALALEPILPETSKKIQTLIRENKKPETPLFLRKD